ncbi:MAG TPA: peptidylprolyl isomerase [Terracidiphilus sp.]|jgi:hypothetical protein
MRAKKTIRATIVCCAGIVLAAAFTRAQTELPSHVLLDRVVAVVNNSAILASDVDREERLSILEPDTNNQAPDPKGALERLISRTLIQQQIQREEELAVSPSEDQVRSRLAEMRKELPACVQAHCAGDEGWSNFLSARKLTQNEVENYVRLRLEMLAFIENRFQQGIRIEPDEIENYYNKTLLPEYLKNQTAPPLSTVSHRIEEILLQQRVNNMFDAWLDNLRKQGDVEILDPSLQTSGETAHGEGDAR